MSLIMSGSTETEETDGAQNYHEDDKHETEFGFIDTRVLERGIQEESVIQSDRHNFPYDGHD